MVEILAGADAELSALGSKGKLALAYGKDMVIWTKRAQAQAEVRHSELVFVGYGIVAPEYAWNDYAGLDVHGKTVLVLMDDPGYAAKDPKVFKGGAKTYYGRWEYKIEEAERQGAAGVLLVHDSGAAGYGWNVVRNTWTGAQLDLATADGGSGHPAIEGWVQMDAARALFSSAGLDFRASAAAAAHAGFKAIPTGLWIDAMLHNSVRRFILLKCRRAVARRQPPSRVCPLYGPLGPFGPRPGASGAQHIQWRCRQCLRDRRPFDFGAILRAHEAGCGPLHRVPRHDRRRARSSGRGVLRREPGVSPGRNRGRDRP